MDEPEQDPPSISIRPEQISILNLMLGNAVQETFCQIDRWNNGYANGLIAACNIVFGEEKPPILKEEYANEKAAEKIGIEALILLRQIVNKHLQGDAITHQVNLATKLLAVWDHNSLAAMEHANAAAMANYVPRIGTLELPSGRIFDFMHLSELLAMSEVMEACEDTSLRKFQHLGLMKGTHGLGTLVAVHETGEEETSFHKIGVLHSLPNNIQIAYV